MNKLITGGLLPVLLVLQHAGQVYALEGTADGSLGVTFTDNARLSESNEIDDQIVSLQIGGSLAKNEGAVTGKATASVSHQEYVDDTFGTRNYLQVGSELAWEPVKKRITVNVRDYFTQTAVDNLSPNVPSNRQNTNALSVSSAIFFPVSPRHNLSLKPAFQDFRYNNSNTDNQQYNLSAGWAYQYRPTMQFSLNAGYSQVEYSSATNVDYDSRYFNLAVTGSTARTRYTASLGKTWVDRAALADNNGVSARLSADIDLSGRSALNVRLTQDITNSSALFLGYAIDPFTGNISNVQTSAETVRNRSMRLTYTRTGTTVNTSIWTELRELDYSSATVDRDVQDIGVRLGYNVSQSMSASLSARFVRNKEKVTSIEQEDRSLDAGLGYRLSRRMNASVGIKYNVRDHTLATSEYDEFSVSAGLGYKIWP